MSDILDDLSPPAVIRAMEANLRTFAHFLAESPRLTLHDDPDVTWFISDVPFPLLNGALCANLDPDSADARIDEILAAFQAAGVPMLWWAGPASRPADVGARLQARGLVQAASAPGMALDLHTLDARAPLPAGVTIARLDRDTMLEGYSSVLLQAFDIPDFVKDVYYDLIQNHGYDPTGDVQNYLAYLDGAPVATASVVYGAGVAGIYNVATVEAARGRGIGAAVTRAPLLAARERGYRVGVLESSDMGYHLYQRLGFEDVCRIDQYLYMPGGGQ